MGRRKERGGRRDKNEEKGENGQRVCEVSITCDGSGAVKCPAPETE